jgi:hypothetical protein
VGIGLCYQTSGGAVTIFTGGLILVTQVGTTLETYAANGSVANLSAGTYTVGYCVRNFSNGAIDSNDYVSGWVMVTNN